LSLSLVSQSPGTDWEEQPVKDAVAKVVADAPTTTLPPAATATAASCFGDASQLIHQLITYVPVRPRAGW